MVCLARARTYFQQLGERGFDLFGNRVGVDEIHERPVLTVANGFFHRRRRGDHHDASGHHRFQNRLGSTIGGVIIVPDQVRVLAVELLVDEEFAHGACQSRPGIGDSNQHARRCLWHFSAICLLHIQRYLAYRHDDAR